MEKTVWMLDENGNIPFEGERVYARYSKMGDIRVPVGNVKTATMIYVMNSNSGEHVLFRAQALDGDDFLYDHANLPYKKATIAMGRNGDMSKDAKFRPLCEKLAEYPKLAEKADKKPRDLLKMHLNEGIFEIPDSDDSDPAPELADESLRGTDANFVTTAVEGGAV